MFITLIYTILANAPMQYYNILLIEIRFLINFIVLKDETDNFKVYINWKIAFSGICTRVSFFKKDGCRMH